MTNLVIHFTNLAFAVMLQSTTDLADENWVDIRQSISACPSAHSISVVPNQPQMFYRAIPLDNGIVPTPGQPHATVNGSSVTLDTGLVFNCNDDPMSYYKWYRDGELIGNGTPHGSEFTDTPPPGVHLYQVKAVDFDKESWLSQGALVYIL
jgi:hypothetical protein